MYPIIYICYPNCTPKCRSISPKKSLTFLLEYSQISLENPSPRFFNCETTEQNLPLMSSPPAQKKHMAYHASTEQTFRTGRSKYFFGGLTSRTGKIHHVQWVNPLFLLGHGFNVANCCGSTRLHPQLGPGWCLHGHKPLMYICILSGWWCN